MTVLDPAYIRTIIDGLAAYGWHRDELFMTRALAKEAAAIIAELSGINPDR